MEPRVLILALPSAVVLALLVAHSLRALPRRRAMAFWGAVSVFGVLRGAAVGWVTSGIGASFPYEIHRPLFEVVGVSLQEVAGWAIVAYLGWWLGWRFASSEGKTPRLFAQVAWASLFLGAISWAVESAAVAAGWWHWRVPVKNALLVNVPAIGLVDWFFVGIDFLLPFVALTAPALARNPARFLTLLAFPLHFGAHALLEPFHPAVPVPVLHLSHWLLLGILLWLALSSRTVDDAFAAERERTARYLPAWPLLGLGIVLAVAAGVELFVAERPELLPSILPAAAVALLAVRPRWGYAAGAAALVAGLALPSLALAAVPAGVAALIAFGHRHRQWAPAAAVVLVVAVAVYLHTEGARRHEELTRLLDEALAARDRGEIAQAVETLEGVREEFPGSHAPRMLLGEIYYRTDRLREARRSFEEAVAIQQDEARAYRFLAVIALRQGDRTKARRAAEQGLAAAPEDLQLAYLARRAGREGLEGILEAFGRLEPEQARALPSLAFEVGDLDGAAALLDEGLTRWPGERWLYVARLRIALAARNGEAARETAAAWLRRFPDDPEARQAVERLTRP